MGTVFRCVARSQVCPLFPFVSVVPSSSLKVLLHPGDSGLGSMSRSSKFFSDIIHHAYQSLVVVTEKANKCQPTSCPATRTRSPLRRQVPPSGLPLVLCFPQHVFGHTATQHCGLPPPLAPRVPERCLTVFEASRTLNVLHLSQQRRRHVSVNTCQGKQRALGNVERRLHVHL